VQVRKPLPVTKSGHLNRIISMLVLVATANWSKLHLPAVTLAVTLGRRDLFRAHGRKEGRIRRAPETEAPARMLSGKSLRGIN
jgi:hypothetical protein